MKLNRDLYIDYIYKLSYFTTTIGFFVFAHLLFDFPPLLNLFEFRMHVHADSNQEQCDWKHVPVEFPVCGNLYGMFCFKKSYSIPIKVKYSVIVHHEDVAQDPRVLYRRVLRHDLKITWESTLHHIWGGWHTVSNSINSNLKIWEIFVGFCPATACVKSTLTFI